ncbi:MAG: multiple sugar transport system ATP-binding protein [Alphaproteobacteria bacterium]|jgi:multiple sugar transport system ATP-binding protein
MPIITLKNITKRYQDSIIINDLNLELDNHDFTVFIGPSGCGKSTLLRLISGLEAVSSGQVLIDNNDVTSLPPAKRNLSMVFQDYALYPHMNIYENIAFALTLAKISKSTITQKVTDISKMMGLDTLLSRKPSELSGGQRQRVAMARALVRDTNLLLMDEPLSNLDAQLRTSLRNELIMLKQKIKRNIIYVTHDQTEAMTLADKIVVLNHGVIQQYDTPQTLYEKPENQFVAEFLGSPKINIIEAEIVKHNDTFYASGKHFKVKLNKYMNKRLKDYKQKKITLGIRPHDLQVIPHKNADNYFKCACKIKEYIGSQHIITALCEQQKIQFEITAKNMQNTMLDDLFYLECSPDKIHFFDHKTGIRII